MKWGRTPSNDSLIPHGMKGFGDSLDLIKGCSSSEGDSMFRWDFDGFECHK